MPVESPQLDYAPPPPRNHRRIRRVAYALVAILIVGAIWQWGGEIWNRIQLVYWERQCLAYRAPEDQVVARSVGKPIQFAPVPRPWRQFVTRLGPRATAPTSPPLFLHARTASNGRQRLVALSLFRIAGVPGRGADLQPLPGLTYYLVRVDLFQPGGLWQRPREMVPSTASLGLFQGPTETLILEAGQPDPADPSHFTIEYRLNDVPGIIDGWLQPDDTVALEVRQPVTGDASAPASSTPSESGSPPSRTPARSPGA